MFNKGLTRLDASALLFDWGFDSDAIVRETANLQYMTSLTELKLWNSGIVDITFLSELSNLTTLSLGNNQIKDITPLSNLTNLTHLTLYGNQVSDLTPLSGLTNLTHLNLCGNQITDLSALSGLTNLTILELADNQINDISSLSGLTNLEELSLDGNQVRDLSPLENLVNLSFLSLDEVKGIDASDRILAEVGEIIDFGGYRWLVLEVQDGHALIITENLLMMGLGQFDNRTTANWGNSFIRQHLNSEFINRLNPSDKSRIRETLVINENNPWFHTSGGGRTEDKIFLLSIHEVLRYFGDSGQLISRPEIMFISDEFNSHRIALFEDGTSRWSWLRSPGGKPNLAVGIDAAGNIVIYGSGINNPSPGVRPAMWINLE